MELEKFTQAQEIMTQLNELNYHINQLVKIKEQSQALTLVVTGNRLQYSLFDHEIVVKAVDFLQKEFSDRRFALQTEFNGI